MNSSARWINYFIDSLECVKCRQIDDLKLYRYDKTEIDPNTTTIEQLHKLIPRMDVWCSNCAVTFGAKVVGPGRLKHKQEAAALVDLKMSYNGNVPETHVLANGTTRTKEEIYEERKAKPCAICGETFPSVIMVFVPKHDVSKRSRVRSMLHTSYTMNEFLIELDTSVVVCPNCASMLKNGLSTIE